MICRLKFATRNVERLSFIRALGNIMLRVMLKINSQLNVELKIETQKKTFQLFMVHNYSKRIQNTEKHETMCKVFKSLSINFRIILSCFHNTNTTRQNNSLSVNEQMQNS